MQPHQWQPQGVAAGTAATPAVAAARSPPLSLLSVPWPAGGAPVTKALMLGTLSTSVIMQASKAARRAPLLISLWTHAFAFRNPGELLFGASLLYFYRLFERQWGSAKYGSFVVVTCGLAYALEAAVGAALGGGLRPAGAAASGPFPLLFANLAANFVLLVPPMHQFAVFGFKMTDKVSSMVGVSAGRQAEKGLEPTDAWPTDGHGSVRQHRHSSSPAQLTCCSLRTLPSAAGLHLPGQHPAAAQRPSQVGGGGAVRPGRWPGLPAQPAGHAAPAHARPGG